MWPFSRDWVHVNASAPNMPKTSSITLDRPLSLNEVCRGKTTAIALTKEEGTKSVISLAGVVR